MSKGGRKRLIINLTLRNKSTLLYFTSNAHCDALHQKSVLVTNLRTRFHCNALHQKSVFLINLRTQLNALFLISQLITLCHQLIFIHDCCLTLNASNFWDCDEFENPIPSETLNVFIMYNRWSPSFIRAGNG